MKEILKIPFEGTGDSMPIKQDYARELLTAKEAASYLQVSMAYIYKLTSDRSIPCYAPTGGKLYFKKTEVDNWVWQHRRCTKDEIGIQTINYINNNNV